MRERDVRRRTIDPSRIAGVTPVELPGNARAIIVRNTAGIGLTLNVDRALDASELLYRGVPLTWYGPGHALAAPSLDPSDDDFERTFFGGLVTTCGLDAFGPAGSDRWGSWPQHGHVNRLPASNVRSFTAWEDPDPAIVVEADVDQFRMFGAALLLRRTWRISIERPAIELHDRVTNVGGRTEPHMLLYHCNIGYPMLDERTSWSLSVDATRPRDDRAAAALAHWNAGGPPQPGFAEQVFIHDPRAERDGWATAAAHNPVLEGGTVLTLSYRPDELPAIFTWRMLGYGTYVMAAEPANCPTIGGRIEAERAGVLPILAPGETRDYRLRFEVSARTPPTLPPPSSSGTARTRAS